MSRASRPSFVFILADDLGYADLGCYGGRGNCSPNLDRIAAEGLRFTDGYSNSPVCSPTRFALATGRWQYRLRGGADEPIASLDVSIRAEILEVLQSLVADHGVGMLYITHDLLSAKSLANHALVLKDGELIESGPAEQVIENPQAAYTRQLLDAIPNPFEKRSAA